MDKREKGDMKIVVESDNISELLLLLSKMDDGYIPSEHEYAYLRNIKIVDLFYNDFDYNMFHTATIAFPGLIHYNITVLPASISNLTHLRILNLAYTQISKLPDTVGLLGDLRKLDFSYTNISVLPASVGLLTDLQELYLCHTSISVLPDSIGSLINLQKIDITSTYVDNLPKSFARLINLRELLFSSTNISILPDFIAKLVNLQMLYLSDTQIGVLPEGIVGLTNLQALYFSGTQIRKLPETIGDLGSLKALDLSRTPISVLPDSIVRLTNLMLLNLSDTEISALPGSIGHLVNLKELRLCHTHITKLPESIGSLVNLQVLDLSNTPISALPDSIENLTSLQVLDLSGTNIKDLPDTLGKLTNLTILNLSGMILNQIPGCILDLSLKFSFDPEAGSGILLHDTTLITQPISLFTQPRKLIAAYYKQDTPKMLINDAKVIFLGDGGVGKTHTIQRLMKGGRQGEYNPELTKGIKITKYLTEYNGTPFNIHFWDFGGQEIMHSMHRCFLTDRTCYVVMVSNRSGNRTQRARYWLKNIESFAHGCPVILAVNLWDTDEGIDGVNGELLENEFPNVKKIITYSAKGSDFEHFKCLTEAIIEQASQLDYCGMEFPQSWANIRSALLELAESEPHISEDQYLALCKKYGEENDEICSWLLDWFNDMGVCFSYRPDNVNGLDIEKYQVLSPEWLVNAIYLIINNGKKYAQQGVLSEEGILDILHRGGGTNPDIKYKDEECSYILKVMRKFRLSYSDNKKNEFIPALCLDKWENAPQIKGWDSHVAYEMRYTYLPDSVLHRLMIFCKNDRLLEQAWSSGMEVRYEMNNLSAVITSEENECVLHIDVYAKEGHKPWKLLQILQDELVHINNNLHLKAVDVIVKKKGNQTAHFPVKSLLKAVDQDITTLYAVDDGELEKYEVYEVLGAAFDPEKVEKEKIEARTRGKFVCDRNINITINNNHGNINVGKDNKIKQINNPAVEEDIKLFREIMAKQEQIPDDFMNKLLITLQEIQKQEPQIKELVDAVETEPKRKWLAKLRNMLEDSANAATVATAIVTYAPDLIDMAKSLIASI